MIDNPPQQIIQSNNFAFDTEVTTNIDPAILRTELPECWMEIQQEIATTFYKNFIAK